jgi:hypothetical protein
MQPDKSPASRARHDSVPVNIWGLIRLGRWEGHRIAMSRTREDLHDSLADDDTSGWMSNLLAEEDEFDRRTLWRLGSWAAGSVGALVVAILATHSSINLRHDQTAVADLLKQSRQVQWIAKESQDEARRLSAAVETLNGDRDRLYSRVTELEQGLDSITGSVASKTVSPGPIEWPTVSMPPVPTLPTLAEAVSLSGGTSVMPAPAKARQSHDHKTELKSGSASEPAVAPVATVAASGPAIAETAAELRTPKGQHPAQVASLSSAPNSVALEPVAEKVVERTEFGVDIGSANSVEGLRALWRGATKTHSAALAALEPIIVVRERSDGLGMRLHLVAGPLADAAAAAKICATLIEGKRACETAIFDGQRLDLQSKKPVRATRRKRHREPETVAEPAPEPPPPPKQGLSSFLGFRSN